MICCGHPLKTRTLRLVAILQKEIAVWKIWDADRAQPDRSAACGGGDPDRAHVHKENRS